MTDIFEYLKNIKPFETQDSTTISETNINFDSDDDYEISEITEHTTSHNVNLTGDDIFIKHNMINLIFLIKQFKRIKNIIQDIQLEVSNINETYDIPQRTEYTYDKTKFQTINVFKLVWLKNITKNGGAQQQLLDQIQPGEIVIKSVTKKHGQIWAIIPKIKLISLASSNHGIYEILIAYPRKVYFDIDKIIDQETTDECKIYLEHIINKLNEYFINAKYSISGSWDNVEPTKWKISFHIVINNYIIINNPTEFTLLKEFVKYLKINFDDAFDINVYALKSQKF